MHRLTAGSARGLSAALIPVIAGCAFGPRTITPDSFDYNQAIMRSEKEQMLLNVVRMRYGDIPSFLEVSSVLTQYTIEAGAGITRFFTDMSIIQNPVVRAIFRVDGDFGKSRTYDGDVRYVERPTITYTPLRGEKFATQIMTPLSIEKLLFIHESGWSLEHLFRICIQSVNSIENTPVDPTRRRAPESYVDFDRIVTLSTELQELGLVRLAVDKQEFPRTTYVYLPAGAHSPVLDEWRELLGLDPSLDRYRLIQSAYTLRDDEIAVDTRSLMAIFAALGKEFPAPVEDVDGGRVEPQFTRVGKDGTLDPLLEIRHQGLPPLDAYASVFYRGSWFYVPHDNIRSKQTFTLLGYLYRLQAGSVPAAPAPVITVPAGG